jgi:hypothetical protein
MNFNRHTSDNISREDILLVGVMIGSMLRLESSARVSPKAVAQDDYSQKD